MRNASRSLSSAGLVEQALVAPSHGPSQPWTIPALAIPALAIARRAAQGLQLLLTPIVHLNFKS
eukprot:15971121-Heterocapsa_arctica.AAC.1